MSTEQKAAPLSGDEIEELRQAAPEDAPGYMQWFEQKERWLATLDAERELRQKTEAQLATSAQTLEQNSAALEAAVAERDAAQKAAELDREHCQHLDSLVVKLGEQLNEMESRLSLAVEVAAEKQREACVESMWREDTIGLTELVAFDAVMEEVDRRVNDGN